MKLRKPNGYWILERCKEDALKYETRMEWKNNSSGSYRMALKMGWSDELTKHMINPTIRSNIKNHMR